MSKNRKKKSNSTLNRKPQTNIKQSTEAQVIDKPTIFSIERQKIHMGPLPDPETLKKYGEIVPELPETIIAEFTNQSRHRRYLEKLVTTSDVIQSYVGQFTAAGLSLYIFKRSFDAIMADKPIVGIAGIATALIGLVTTFLLGKRIQQKQLEKKNPNQEQ